MSDRPLLLVSVALCSASVLLIQGGLEADVTGFGVLVQVADITALIVVGAIYLYNQRAAGGRTAHTKPAPAPARATSKRVDALSRKYGGYKVEL